MTLDDHASDKGHDDRSLGSEDDEDPTSTPGSGSSASPGQFTESDVTVAAISVKRCRTTRDVAVLCPFCGRVHHHGWGYDSSDHPGWRISHCALSWTRGGRRVVPVKGTYYILAPSGER